MKCPECDYRGGMMPLDNGKYKCTECGCEFKDE